MPIQKFPYKGKEIVIDRKGDEASVKIDDKTFRCVLHRGNLDMWHCEDAYFASPDIRELARHFVDYMYIFTDPNTAPPVKVEEEGHDHGSHGHEQDHSHEHEHDHDHDHDEEDHSGHGSPATKKRASGRRRSAAKKSS